MAGWESRVGLLALGCTPDMVATEADRLGLDCAGDSAAIADLAAIALTVDLWRNSDALERVHGGDPGIADADMLRLNVATWRAVRSRLGPRDIDWPGLLATLSDAQRPLPGSRTVAGLLGDVAGDLADHVATLGRQLAFARDKRGDDHLMVAGAVHAAREHRGWYGTPWWPLVVEQLLEDAGDPWSAGSQRCASAGLAGPAPGQLAELAAVLRARPEDLEVSMLHWCLAMGIGSLGAQGYLRWRSER